MYELDAKRLTGRLAKKETIVLQGALWCWVTNPAYLSANESIQNIPNKMKRLLRLLIVSFLISSNLTHAEDTIPSERDTLAQKATELRMAHAASKEYNPYDRSYRDHSKAANDALNNDNFPKAIAEAKAGLELAKYDIELLMTLSAAYRANGEQEKADATKAFWTSLVDSIFRSGNGRSYATAFHVINVSEEYTLIHILGLDVKRQSLQAHEGSEYDVFELADPRSDKQLELYFNIDLQKKWLNRQFSDAKK